MLALSRYALRHGVDAEDQLAGPPRRRADHGRAVLRDGSGCTGSRWSCSTWGWRWRCWPRRCTCGGVAELARAPRRVIISATSSQTLKLSLTLWDRRLYSLTRQPDPGESDSHGHVSRPRLAERSGAQGAHQAADRGGDGDLLQAADPAREDRHPASRAREPPAQEGRERRAGHHRRRRPAAHRHPRRPGADPKPNERPCGARRVTGRWPSTAPSADLATPMARTTASAAGPFWPAPSSPPATATATYKIGETGEIEEIDLEDGRRQGSRACDPRRGRRVPARASRCEGDRMTVGRRPDCDIFLDDVTVSRDHAVIVHRGHDYYLDDCGSLNGTYVNRKPDRVPPAGRRRRAPSRQVQARVPEPLMASPETTDPAMALPDPRAPGGPFRAGARARRR